MQAQAHGFSGSWWRRRAVGVPSETVVEALRILLAVLAADRSVVLVAGTVIALPHTQAHHQVHPGQSRHTMAVTGQQLQFHPRPLCMSPAVPKLVAALRVAAGLVVALRVAAVLARAPPQIQSLARDTEVEADLVVVVPERGRGRCRK